MINVMVLRARRWGHIDGTTVPHIFSPVLRRAATSAYNSLNGTLHFFVTCEPAIFTLFAALAEFLAGLNPVHTAREDGSNQQEREFTRSTLLGSGRRGV
jgi:hypothetical protein